MSKTKKVVLWPKDDGPESLLKTILMRGGERGCTLAQFKDVFDFTKLKHSHKVL